VDAAPELADDGSRRAFDAVDGRDDVLIAALAALPAGSAPSWLA
jgi:hypothetical protein